MIVSSPNYFGSRARELDRLSAKLTPMRMRLLTQRHGHAAVTASGLDGRHED
jgi:hypothetical protein